MMNVERNHYLRLLFEAELELRRKDSVDLADKIREALKWSPVHEKIDEIHQSMNKVIGSTGDR